MLCSVEPAMSVTGETVRTPFVLQCFIIIYICLCVCVLLCVMLIVTISLAHKHRIKHKMVQENLNNGPIDCPHNVMINHPMSEYQFYILLWALIQLPSLAVRSRTCLCRPSLSLSLSLIFCCCYILIGLGLTHLSGEI